MNGLEIIKGAGVLTDSDFAALADMKSELLQTMETVQIFRTKTEMKVSVTNDMKCPTWDSKYWQAVREQNVMFTELVMLSYEYRKNALRIKKLKIKLGELKASSVSWIKKLKRGYNADKIEQDLLQVEIERKQFIGISMERTAKDRIREIKEWSAIKAELLPHLKYGDRDVNLHQLEAMRIKFGNQERLVNEHTAIADAKNILGLADMSVKLSDLTFPYGGGPRA